MASVEWIVKYGIVLLLMIGFMPGLVGINDAVLGKYDNTNDPSFIALSLFPFFIFAIYLFRPWQLMGGEGGY